MSAFCVIILSWGEQEDERLHGLAVALRHLGEFVEEFERDSLELFDLMEELEQEIHELEKQLRKSA